MTDEQICGTIAESLEPFDSSWNEAQFDGEELGERWYSYLNGDFHQPPRSPLACWKFGATHGGIIDWSPVNFFTDPAATLMLMERPGFMSVKARIKSDIQEYQATFLKASWCKPFICESEWSDSIPRAIVLAYLKTIPAAEEKA